MRNMSFALTTPQFYQRLKTVTRRLGWMDLEPGNRLCGVEKSQGLRPGQPIVRLAIIHIKSVTRVRLNSITQDDVIREGFPNMAPREFVRMFVDSHETATNRSTVTRIEFDYVPGGRFTVPGFCRLCGFTDRNLPNAEYRGPLWVDRAGFLTSKPTSLCSACHYYQRFGQAK
ncbi:ASCH domain-containing protein [Schlesneria paludicola]|uniref:hypothetical protein n=1 Tax=Schlesneria paludicola TaxID=360056 RepID=UPI00029B12D9|nr:hypothetical protein [Schlesneria paludicola]